MSARIFRVWPIEGCNSELFASAESDFNKDVFIEFFYEDGFRFKMCERNASFYVVAYPHPLSIRTSCENGRLIARQGVVESIHHVSDFL